MTYKVRKWIKSKYNRIYWRIRYFITPPVIMLEGETLSQVLARTKSGQTIIMAAKLEDWKNITGSSGTS